MELATLTAIIGSLALNISYIPLLRWLNHGAGRTGHFYLRYGVILTIGCFVFDCMRFNLSLILTFLSALVMYPYEESPASLQGKRYPRLVLLAATVSIKAYKCLFRSLAAICIVMAVSVSLSSLITLAHPPFFYSPYKDVMIAPFLCLLCVLISHTLHRFKAEVKIDIPTNLCALMLLAVFLYFTVINQMYTIRTPRVSALTNLLTFLLCGIVLCSFILIKRLLPRLSAYMANEAATNYSTQTEALIVELLHQYSRPGGGLYPVAKDLGQGEALVRLQNENIRLLVADFKREGEARFFLHIPTPVKVPAHLEKPMFELLNIYLSNAWHYVKSHPGCTFGVTAKADAGVVCFEVSNLVHSDFQAKRLFPKPGRLALGKNGNGLVIAHHLLASYPEVKHRCYPHQHPNGAVYEVVQELSIY